MMKKLLIAVLISGAALNAMAADTADLTVKGKLTNSACTPSFSGGGVVDYGSIYLGGLSATSDNQLGVKDFTFTITCTGPTVVAWTNFDNRASSRAVITVANGTAAGEPVSSGSALFGLGMTGDVPLGAAVIYADVSNVQVDGASKELIRSQNGEPWTKLISGTTEPGVRDISFAEAGTTTPVAGTVFIVPMKVSVAVKDTATLGITDKVPLDGNATFTVIYL